MRLVYGSVGLLLILGVVLSPSLAVSYSSGAPPAANGSPVSMGGIGDCTGCHFTYEVNEGDGSVTIDAPATFVPGETLTFTITVDNTTPPMGEPLQGFEVSIEDDEAVAHVGTLVIVDEENTQFTAAGGEVIEEYVTHTTPGNQQTSWTVGWTAPVDAPETVTIYAAGNAANGNFSPTDDYIYTAAVTLSRVPVANEEEVTPLVARVDAIYPNPFAQVATVDYTLARPMPVTVTLYDGLGRAIRVLEEGARGAGAHTVRVEGERLPAGVYFVEVRTPEVRVTRPLTLAR